MICETEKRQKAEPQEQNWSTTKHIVRLEAIASRLEAIALRFEAIALRFLKVFFLNVVTGKRPRTTNKSHLVFLEPNGR